VQFRASLGRERDADERLHQRTGHPHHLALQGEDPVQVPASDIGEGQQLQGLAGGCAVDDQHVEFLPLGMAADPHQARHLLHPGRRGQLLGDDLVDPLAVEQHRQIVVNAVPMPLHLVEGIDLLGKEILADLDRLGTELEVEAVPQAVRGVGGDHQGPQPELRTAHGGGGGDGGFAHTTFARVEDHAHLREYRDGPKWASLSEG
jgi:hypothetical protein